MTVPTRTTVLASPVKKKKRKFLFQKRIDFGSAGTLAFGGRLKEKPSLQVRVQSDESVEVAIYSLRV